MADTFGSCWRAVLLHCPFVPVPLAQHWVRDRYRQLLDVGGQWGAQNSESQFIIPDAYSTGTVTLTNGSAAVVGAGTTFTSGMVGRQLYTGGAGPYYTISAFTDGTNITLERAFGGTTGAGLSYEIAQCYVTPPSDFLYFKTIKDPVNNWRLRFNYSQEWLDRVDARRTTTGSAWVFVDYRHNSSGVPRYEVWPRVVSQTLYPFLYVRRPADLNADSDTPIFPIRGDELVTGALADLARWPGTETRRNPMFDLRLANDYEKQFQEEVNHLSRVDQETYLSDLVMPGDDWSSLPWCPWDQSWIQSHAVGGF